MIDLTKMHADKVASTIERAQRGGYDPGIVIVYHDGDYSDMVGRTGLGSSVRALFDAGRVDLFQKRVSDEPRKYVYYAVTK